MVQVLQVDRAGLPVRWLSLEKAAGHESKGNVAWGLGDSCMTLRGGTNAKTGLLSTLQLRPIISVIGDNPGHRPWAPPSLSSRKLFHRDKLMCAYCGQCFQEHNLTLDHIHPQSRGGADSWMNLVAACKHCNNRKDNRTPEEARMPLLYVPYVPNLQESFILGHRTILANQMDFLLQSVPKHSRLWA